MIVPTDGFLDTVPPLRDQLGADLVTLISEDAGASGVAYIPYLTGNFYSAWGYSVINSGQLSAGTMAHELGHNLGCNHDRGHLNSTGQSPTPYGFGHQSCGVDGLGFRDIMSYECTSGGYSQRLNYFSSPWLRYLGKPLGIDYAVDPANATDNARTIREIAPIVASFRASLQSLPTAPTSLSATSPAFNRVDLTWVSSGSDQAGFEVQRSDDGGSSWTTVGIVSSGTGSFTDRPLSAGDTYQHRVRAFNSAGTGLFSSSVTTTTAANETVPSAPTGLVITHVSAARIDLKWTDTANSEDGFKIKRSINGGPHDEIADLGADATGYNDGDQLVMGNTYDYRVIPYTDKGDGARLSGSLYLAPPPTAPTGLYFVPVTTTSAQLVWADTSTTENGFNLERSTDGLYFFLWATRTANVTSITNTSLISGVTYSYRIWSQNYSGQSATAATGSFTWGQVPATPSAVQATAVSANVVKLTWGDNSLNESAFYLERSLDDVNYAPLASVGPNTTTYFDTPVAPGTYYCYRVRAYNLFGYSSYPTSDLLHQNQITTGSDPKPAAPSGLTATANSPSQVTVQWVDNSTDEFSFDIERSTGGGAFVQVGSAPADATSYIDASVTAGTTYSYRVSAANDVGTSAYTASATVTTPVPLPATPGNPIATANSSSQITLTWVDASSNETGFSIEQSTSGGAYAVVATVGANVTSYVNTGLSASTTYTYRVRASNTGGYSAYSPTTSGTTFVPVPATPGNPVAIANSSSQITLTWVDASSNETGFSIERSPGGGAYVVAGTVGANVTSFVDTGLSGSTTYTYRLRASNVGGFSAYSATVFATTLVPVPATPSSPIATANSSSQITLSWVDASSNETGFSIERSTGGAYAVVGTVSANVTSYINTGLNSSTTYTYRVRASNTGGYSAYSTTTSATTPAVPIPTAPSGLTATVDSSSKVTLKWSDNANNESNYYVERSVNGAAYSVVATLSANTTTYANSSLSSGTTYAFRVRAGNSGGYSAYSAVATTKTSSPSSPSSLSAGTFAKTSLVLTWVDNSNNETGFSIERLSGSKWSQILTTGAGINSVTVTGLTANTSYSFRVRAYNGVGNSSYTSTLVAKTLP